MRQVGYYIVLAFAAIAGVWAQGARPPRVVLILLGGPGSGKGTQAEFLTKNYGFPALSTGEMLRSEEKAETPLGRKIHSALASGQLVSDDIVNELVASRTEQLTGFILDGYPRTLAQANYLKALLKRRGYAAPVVLHLDVPEEELIRRLTARGRKDDKPDIIRERLRVYERETRPLLDYYGGTNYHRIDGTGAPEQVAARIRAVVDKTIVGVPAR